MLTIIVVAGLAFGSGWLLRGLQSSEPEVVVRPVTSPEVPVPNPVSVQRATIAPFDLALSEVRVMLGEQRFALAYDRLNLASSLAVTPVQDEEFKQLLGQLVDLYTRELVALQQAEQVDEFYQQLTLDYPQYAEYQFQLGKIRVQMGNLQAALGPLAQVTNHPQFGPRARQLIAQIEDSDTRVAQVELPLQRRDGQFIVAAQLDQGLVVNLLIDTGAAMTAIDRGVLQQAGYDLNTEQQYFATANGVVAAPVLTLAELSLGETRVSNLAVGALPLKLAGNVVGLLGMNYLRHFDFRIDQDRSVLILDQR